MSFADAAVRYNKSNKNYVPFGGARRSGEVPGFTGGLKASSLGQVAGYEEEGLPQEAGILESLPYKIGSLAGDLPAMLAGGLVGGPIAGTAGAFAAPELIKQLVKYKRSSGSESIMEALGKMAQVPWETGKQGLVGAATGGLGHLAGLGKLISPTSKIMQSGLGKEAVKTGAEFVGMTGAQAALEGELPTGSDLVSNLMLLGGMKAIGPAAKAIRKPITKRFPALKSEALKAKAIEQVKKIKPVREMVERYKKSKPFFEMVKKTLGEKDASIIEKQMKWKDSLDKVKDIATKENLEELTYYAQKTKNPQKKGDTFEALSERIPKPMRNIVDKELRPHLKETLKEVNRQNYTKKINPSEGLAEKYMPGMYENAEHFPAIEHQVAKQMKFRNPHANQKVFMDYNQAWIEAGMKPRFKNFFDFINLYDEVNAKNIAGSNLLTEISKTEKKSGDRLIVTTRDPVEYQKAKGQGYVPYEDLTLRGYTPDGKLGKPTVRPALVAPEVSDAVQGIFSKEAYKPTNKFVKALRNLSDVYRLGRVRLSYFHYVPLTESSAGALGVKKALNLRELARQGYSLRSDPNFMKDAVKHGLTIHKSVERFDRAMKTSQKLFDYAEKNFPKTTKFMQSKYNIPARALKAFARSQDYMFKQYHPNLKAVTWQDFVSRAIEKASKEGKSLNDSQVYKLKTGMAELVNNMYGGQNWNAQRVFNSKKYRTWLRDVIAYPDWTTSALKQAANAFAPGLKGQASRKYWMQFGINYMMAHGLLKFLSGSIQKDKEGFSFDASRGLKEITNPDPLSWHKFPLPNIEFNVGGLKFNPGKDDRGRRLYSHFGKQALEVKDWMYHPFSTYFGKANPLIQEAYKQLTGQTPGKDVDYSVRGKWKNGKFRSWDATKPGTAARAVSRASALAESAIPFSVRTLASKGPAAFAATGMGAVPVSLGATPHKAASALEKAFKKKDYKMITRIKRALRQNGYKASVINRAVNKARREVRNK